MARRGDALREHILDQAKAVFLDTGFERTSMDAVAARAATSKRSLYAHFATKEALFLAVVDHVGELFHDRMQAPADYSDDPAEASALYCGRFLQLLMWASVIQTLRLGIAAAAQFPDAAARLHDIFFEATTTQLAAHLHTAAQLADADAHALAGELLGATVYPELPRLLFGTSPTRPDRPVPDELDADVDLDAIRRQVRALLSEMNSAA